MEKTFIKHLELFDWRSYSHIDLNFDQKNIVFYGPNGKGKTNILEAISLLALGKSWRTSKNAPCILQTADSAKITGKVNHDTYSLILQPRSKKLSKNTKVIPLKKHIGNIPVLIFAPEQLTLFSGPKADRQRFFDRFLCQMSPQYYEALSLFDKALKQRNRLLKEEFVSEAELAPWETILSKNIPIITRHRDELCKTFTPLLQQSYQELAGNHRDLNLKLKNEFIDQLLQEDHVRNLFHQIRPREIAARRTLVGSHRDDYLFSFNKTPLTECASRGEQRSVLLSLLSAQKDKLVEATGKYPILLLDDVFSELDQERQKQLEKLCESSQIFFTTTHKEHFEGFEEDLQMIDIEEIETP